jgi:hypothetical protein
MARIRTIKPEFPQSESMGAVSREARLCFILLWTQADDAGRIQGDSKRLASLLYPYDADAPSLIDGWLGELESQGCVVRTGADATTIVRISDWTSFQSVPREWDVSDGEWQTLRAAVFKRDGYRCVYCGSPERLACDHVTPLSRGGPSVMENLATACTACNCAKGARTLAEWRPEFVWRAA